MVSSIGNLVHALAYELLKDLRPSSQSLFLKLNFGNSSKKRRNKRYQTFLDLSNFTEFLYFVPNVLSRIVGSKKWLDPLIEINELLWLVTSTPSRSIKVIIFLKGSFCSRIRFQINSKWWNPSLSMILIKFLIFIFFKPSDSC